ncbi:hypothetical protein MY1884_002377 [Beauveria asiatica]
MKAVLQRVLSGSVTVEKELVSSIGRGVLVFAAVAPGDTEKEMESMANKWKKSVTDISGEVLCVSQFTLLAKTTKGTKPDFHGAANPEEARRLYQYFVQKVQADYQADRVKDGRFQAMMEVALVNDGPVSTLAGRLHKTMFQNSRERIHALARHPHIIALQFNRAAAGPEEAATAAGRPPSGTHGRRYALNDDISAMHCGLKKLIRK